MTGAQGKPILELRDVSLRFDHMEHELLRNINLTMAAGDCIGVTGPSGGGKTLLGLIAADVIPRLIRAHVGGEIVRNIGDETHRTRAAVVFQDPSFQLFSRTVRDELLFLPRRLGWPAGMVDRDLDVIIGGLDIGHLLDRDPRRLSMGEIQRVAVAVALVQRPRILIMDEPTQYLDCDHVARTLEFTAGYARSLGTSLFLIEHHIDLLNRFCDRTFVVYKGNLNEAILTEPPYPDAPAPRRHDDTAVITVDDISFGYAGGDTVIDGCSFEIRRGEAIALFGPNGSGKSTLAKLLCGLYSPRRGSIARHTVTNGSPFRSIGLVMQNPDRQIFASTVRDECAFGPRNFGILRETYEPRIAASLSEFGLGDFENRDPLTLSYGEKRRVNITGIEVCDPQVMILDEPTTGLDYRNRLILLHRIRRWQAAGRAIVIATHDRRFAAACCQRAISLDDGRIVADESLEDTTEVCHAAGFTE